MIAIVGALVVHLLGGAARHLATRCGLAVALRSPTTFFFGLAVLYAFSLGPAGLVVLAALGIGVSLGVRPEPAVGLSPRAGLGLAGLAAVVLARPWVPTQWDEFVWLAKARFASLGFAAGVQAALDPAQKLVPPGYPPLWPLAVGWVSLGVDALDAHVVAASLLVVLCVAVAVESWKASLGSVPRWSLLLLVAAPLVLVHLRSTYVDLPIGLLGLALLGQLLQGSDRPAPAALALAVTLAGFKDEGLAHVLAATAAAWFLSPRLQSWRLAVPALVALLTFATWRVLVRLSGVALFDHALGLPQWDWAPRFLQLLVLHASDLPSWGVFWAVVLGVLFTRPGSSSARALRFMFAFNLCFTAAALLSGPERVRVFAENGTLINRLLVQLWPGALVLVFSTLRPTTTSAISSRGA